MAKFKLLIGGPVRQKPAVLQHFLESLRRMETGGIEVDYLFIDDNTDELSANMLREFALATGRAEIVRQPASGNETYLCDDHSHHWREALIWKVAAMKDRILATALQRKYSHVFLADSDLVFDPRTLLRLLGDRKDIVSALYWTQWQPGTLAMPQVWLHGEYELYPLARQHRQTDEELTAQTQKFMFQLRTPGVYKVGGLGACTLISRKALKAGVRFEEIPNLGYWGEDRHFCIRAAALGLDLFVDTTYPAYHIYRGSDIEGVEDYIANGWNGERNAEQHAAGGEEGQRHYRQALEMIACGYNQAAIQELETFLAIGGNTTDANVRALLEIDACYGRSGSADKGRERLLRAMGAYRTAEIYCRLGAKCMDKANWREAIAWFKLAIQTERPQNWEQSPDISAWMWKPYIQMCVCYTNLNEFQRAFEFNELGLRFDPQHSGMLSNREFLLRQLRPAPVSASATSI
ncbi:glycosyltransferase family protein [Paenibacillus cymbidii]|uniref:hypothetical protein n=1 Tax=Paenibacillus cymbidii TaxID=1639034 RepID=UPI001A9AA229|nr:hypothetical protein [Paenibacillus cymbidii]